MQRRDMQIARPTGDEASSSGQTRNNKQQSLLLLFFQQQEKPSPLLSRVRGREHGSRVTRPVYLVFLFLLSLRAAAR